MDERKGERRQRKKFLKLSENFTIREQLYRREETERMNEWIEFHKKIAFCESLT